MTYTLFLFLAFVLQGWICALFFSTIVPCRYGFRRTFALHCAIQIIPPIINIVVAQTSPTVNFFCTTFIYLVEILWLCKTRLSIRIALFLVWLIGSIFIESAGTTLLMLILNLDYTQMMQYALPRITASIVITSIWGIYFIIVYLWKKHLQREISGSKTALFLLFPVGQVTLLSCLHFGVTVRQFHTAMFYLLYLGLIISMLADVLLVKMMLALEQKARLEQMLKTAEAVAALQMQQYTEHEHQNKKFAAMRHDYKNYVATITRLANTPTAENLAQIQSLGNAVCEELSYPPTAQYSDHSIANAVLAAKAEQCEKLGIVFSCEVLFPQNFRVTDLHLCSALSNLFDNAIHGVQNLPPPQRYIVFKAAQRGGFVYIRTENPFDDDKTKKGTGQGLCILRDIAGKYAGDFITTRNHGVFSAILSLRL